MFHFETYPKPLSYAPKSGSTLDGKCARLSVATSAGIMTLVTSTWFNVSKYKQYRKDLREDRVRERTIKEKTKTKMRASRYVHLNKPFSRFKHTLNDDWSREI
jgi:hypothetical protein